jgi:MmyB-like transcription regulator ligand binding domain
MLEAHEPYPAVVMDRHWNVMTSNSAADAFFGWLLGDRELEEPANVIRLMFDPDGLRPFVRNWEDIAEALIQRVHREAVGGFPDTETVALLEQALAYPGVPSEWRTPDFRTPPLPVVPVGMGEGPARAELLLDRHDARNPSGRDAPGDPHRELLPDRRAHRGPHLDPTRTETARHADLMTAPGPRFRVVWDTDWPPKVGLRECRNRVKGGAPLEPRETLAMSAQARSAGLRREQRRARSTAGGHRVRSSHATSSAA